MLNYTPSITGAKFLNSRARRKLLMGPVGGGKSTVALMDLLGRAVRQKPHGAQRVRRTKFLIVRNTRDQLRATVKPLIETWFVSATNGTMGKWQLTDMTFVAKFKLPDGTIVHSDFILLAADTQEDVRRLLSLEVSAAWLEECREIDPTVSDGVQSRTNRYPSMINGGASEPGVIYSTNPPPLETYWAETIENPPKGMEVFRQPPALREDGSLNDTDLLDDAGNVIMARAENLENLPPTYYADLVEGKTEDWVGVYLKNKFGAGNSGKPLYKDTFKPSTHRSMAPLRAVAGRPILIGMDNGLQAAAAIGQQDAWGCVNILAEAYVKKDDSMGIERFLDTILIPKLNEKFPGLGKDQFMFVLDPACFQRSQVNEATIAQAVIKRGYRAVEAPGNNDVTIRISSVEQLLTRMVDGRPGLRVDPSCTHILNTLEHGHQYKKLASGLPTNEIAKNHYSHMGDGVQYLCLGFHFPTMTGPRKVRARPVVPRKYHYV